MDRIKISHALQNTSYRIVQGMAYTGGYTLGKETNKDWFNIRKANNEWAANFEPINLN